MLRSRLAAFAAAGAVASAPVAVALAVPAAGPSPAGPHPLDAALAGHTSVVGEFRDHVHGRLLAERGGLVRRLARVGGSPAAIVGAPARSLPGLRRENRALRAEIRQLDVPIPPILERIAECESHGDLRAIGGGGAYRGKYQFATSTWAAVGGTGDPAAAPEAEQDRRAALLLARSGPGQWPVCSR